MIYDALIDVIKALLVHCIYLLDGLFINLCAGNDKREGMPGINDYNLLIYNYIIV